MRLKGFIWCGCFGMIVLGSKLGSWANVPREREAPETSSVLLPERQPNSPRQGGSKYEIGEQVPVPGYESATLMKIEHNGIKVMHAQGVALILSEHLSPELRSRYELDNLDKVMERLRERNERLYQARRAQALKLSQRLKFRLTGKVLQVLPDRLLIPSARILAGKEPSVTRHRSGRHVIGTGPSLRDPDGVPVDEEVEKVVWNDVWRSLNDVILMKCPTKGIVDDSRFEMEVYYLGTMTYTTHEQREKTVYYFGTDLNDAVDFAMEWNPSELPDFLKGHP